MKIRWLIKHKNNKRIRKLQYYTSEWKDIPILKLKDEEFDVSKHMAEFFPYCPVVWVKLTRVMFLIERTLPYMTDAGVQYKWASLMTTKTKLIDESYNLELYFQENDDGKIRLLQRIDGEWKPIEEVVGGALTKKIEDWGIQPLNYIRASITV